jgi:hypothetical protein
VNTTEYAVKINPQLKTLRQHDAGLLASLLVASFELEDPV